MAKRPAGKTYHLALLLPLTGLFFLMPPAAYMFGMPAMLGGIPVIVVYIFSIWGLLILGAALLAKNLAPAADDDPPPDLSASGVEAPD